MQTTIAPYHAQANPVERTNRTLKAMMAIFVDEDHREWDLHLSEFAYAMNTTVHSSTRLTPAFLNFGRNPRPPLILKQSLEQQSPVEPGNPQSWANRLQRLPAIYDLVHTHLDCANRRQARYYNKNRRNIAFKVGDLVVRRNRVLSSAVDQFAAKLAPKFTGPCRIEKIISPVVYELKDVENNRVSKVHIADLKPFVASKHLDISNPTGSSRDHGKGSRERKRPGSQGQTTSNTPPRTSISNSANRGYNLRPRETRKSTADADRGPRRRGRPRKIRRDRAWLDRLRAQHHPGANGAPASAATAHR